MKLSSWHHIGLEQLIKGKQGLGLQYLGSLEKAMLLLQLNDQKVLLTILNLLYKQGQDFLDRQYTLIHYSFNYELCLKKQLKVIKLVIIHIALIWY